MSRKIPKEQLVKDYKENEIVFNSELGLLGKVQNDSSKAFSHVRVKILNNDNRARWDKSTVMTLPEKYQDELNYMEEIAPTVSAIYHLSRNLSEDDITSAINILDELSIDTSELEI